MATAIAVEVVASKVARTAGWGAAVMAVAVAREAAAVREAVLVVVG